LCCVLWPARARAQAWVSDAHMTVSSGIEGGDTGSGVGLQRARLRLTFGLDLGNDEHAKEAWGARTFVELERHLSVGAELGYLLWIAPKLNVFFGGVGVITPKTLFGGTVAVTYRIMPIGERFGLDCVGSFSALPLGSDRPSDGVVIWGLLGIGVRGRL
jgi:hypothetical protein